MDETKEDVKTTQLQIRIREDVKEDLKIVAEIRGQSVSGVILSLITKAIHETKAEHPALFGVEHIPPHRSRFDVYAKALGGEGFSESEWQLMETYFKQHVETWKQFQRERVETGKNLPEQKPVGKVIARIDPGVNQTKEDVRRMVFGDESAGNPKKKVA